MIIASTYPLWMSVLASVMMLMPVYPGLTVCLIGVIKAMERDPSWKKYTLVGIALSVAGFEITRRFLLR